MAFQSWTFYVNAFKQVEKFLPKRDIMEIDIQKLNMSQTFRDN